MESIFYDLEMTDSNNRPGCNISLKLKFQFSNHNSIDGYESTIEWVLFQEINLDEVMI